MIHLKFFLPAALTVIALQANAAEKNFCLSAESLSNFTEECDDNNIIGDSAIICLNQFEKKIKLASTGASLAINTATANKKDTQANNLNSSKVTYQISLATLDILIAEGEKRAKETKAYKDKLVWPEDADADFVEDLEKFLQNDPCYADNAKILKAVEKHFDKNLSDLKRARDIAAKNEATSATSESNIKINATSTAGIAKDGAKPEVKVKAVQKPGGSTISGKTEDQKINESKK